MKPSPRAHHRTITTLLHDAIDTQESDDITINTLLVPLRSRAFGVVLLVLAIPNFIPLPIGIGGIMGVLTIVLGFEMLCGLEQPLIPARLRRKTMHRSRVKNFLARTAKIMHWLERWCKPRMDVVERRPWSLVSGLAMVILGLLLSLPIPFTNYLFGVILLAFAFALIERDGALLIAMWILAAILLTLAVIFSGALLHEIEHVLQILHIY